MYVFCRDLPIWSSIILTNGWSSHCLWYFYPLPYTPPLKSDENKKLQVQYTYVIDKFLIYFVNLFLIY